jgi:hypothetical protein
MLTYGTSVAGQLQQPNDLLWGPTVRGAKIGLSGGGLLRVGQPLEFVLKSEPPSRDGPYVHIHWGEHGSAKLEMRDDKNQPVPFRMQLFEQSSSPDGDSARFRLWPTETHAERRYWKPGVYQLNAIVEAAGSPLRPHVWSGELTSNTLRIEIQPANAALPALLDEPELRKKL